MQKEGLWCFHVDSHPFEMAFTTVKLIKAFQKNTKEDILDTFYRYQAMIFVFTCTRDNKQNVMIVSLLKKCTIT